MLLDNEAMNYIRQRKIEGATYKELETEIHGLGYRTSNGNKIWHSEISKFACANGLRTNVTKRVRGPKFRDVETYKPEEIQLLINQLRNEGLRAGKIAKRLNRLGYTTTTGLKFNIYRMRDFEKAMEINPPTKKVAVEKTVAAKIKKAPLMIMQGTNDEAALFSEILRSGMSKGAKLAIIEQMIK